MIPGALTAEYVQHPVTGARYVLLRDLHEAIVGVSDPFPFRGEPTSVTWHFIGIEWAQRVEWIHDADIHASVTST